jgi:hypothetical protein
MEEYLTVAEVAARIKYCPQSIYNFIYRGKFVLGVHYFKPTNKKILFIWSAVEQWLYGSSINAGQEGLLEKTKTNKSNNLINK